MFTYRIMHSYTTQTVDLLRELRTVDGSTFRRSAHRRRHRLHAITVLTAWCGDWFCGCHGNGVFAMCLKKKMNENAKTCQCERVYSVDTGVRTLAPRHGRHVVNTHALLNTYQPQQQNSSQLNHRMQNIGQICMYLN